MKTWYLFLGMTTWTFMSLPEKVTPSYPSYGSSSEPEMKFLPADSGETPTCVKDPRLTFCVEPEKYPKDRITYLVENKMYDVDTFLQDETRDTYTFEARDGPTYPTPMMYQPSSRPTNGYPKARVSYPPTLPGRTYRKPKKNRYNAPRLNMSSPTSSSYPYGQRPSKYGSTNHFKLHTPSHPPFYSNHSSPPALNSFNPFPSKYESPQRINYYQGPTPSGFTNGPSSRYPKVGFPPALGTPSASYRPSQSSRTWRKKSGHRRQKRQAGLTDFCPSRASYIRPRAAQNIGGDWMFLVNLDEQYTQLVRSETCIRNACSGSCDAPEGFLAVCQQQYVQKRLVALDGSGSKLNSDTFWFPSCCLCKIRPGAG